MHSRARLLVLSACLLLAIFCLAWPMYVIRPFRPQGPAELDSALAVLRLRPYLLGACLLLSLAVAAVDWRHAARRSRKFVLAAIPLTIALAAGLSRVNIFEIMFHRIDAPAFQSAAQTSLDADEKVIAVSIKGAARAYPIRALAYHHIVNDTIEGVPLVGTY